MENKICNRCHVEKPISEYHRHPTAKYGVSNTCKQCHKEYGRQHRLKPEYNAKRRDRYASDPDYRLRKKEWDKKRKRNKGDVSKDKWEITLERHREYYKKMPEHVRFKIKETSRQYRTNLRDAYISRNCLHMTGFVPQELIDAKRELILLRRKLKMIGGH